MSQPFRALYTAQGYVEEAEIEVEFDEPKKLEGVSEPGDQLRLGLLPLQGRHRDGPCWPADPG